MYLFVWDAGIGGEWNCDAVDQRWGRLGSTTHYVVIFVFELARRDSNFARAASMATPAKAIAAVL